VQSGAIGAEDDTRTPIRRFRALDARISGAEVAPFAITSFRIGLFPLLTIGLHAGVTAGAAAWIVGAGFFSDVMDGYVARWLRVSNAVIRGFDSFADTIFYLAALYATFYFRADVLYRHRVMIASLILSQFVEHLIEVRKFGKPASYHAMSAKVWGATLPVALISVMVSGRDDFLVLAIIAGFISHADCFVITCILPIWTHDVATPCDALAIRRAASAATSAI